MSLSFRHLAERDETARLVQRLGRIKASLDWSREAIPADVVEQVSEAIERCEQRLELGVDHAIVALAGGTGSGKSSLFNAIVGKDFAVPGVARPTTAHVSAAVWGDGATPLLEWLEVAPDRRLVAPDDDRWHGLIVLDLPDHDSVNSANRDVVDRVVPMADLLVWVVDPQKYADHALHSAYLSVASGHGQPSLVVLNQVDRLRTEDAWEIVKDMHRLLAEDGLGDITVLPVSATTGEGVEDLRSELERVHAGHTVAWQAVRSDLVAAGKALARALARDAEPVMPDITEVVHELARAAGVNARAEAAARVVQGKATQVPSVAEVSVATVERERMDWIDEATARLPRQWHTVVDEAVQDAEVIMRDVNDALATVQWPEATAVSGWSRWAVGKARAALVRRETLARGRDVISHVLIPHVVEPTETIHQSYRALDELTELD